MRTQEEKQKKLTHKQRLFIDEYLQTKNATEAAKKAGYSEKTSGSLGHRLLHTPEIKKEIDKQLDEIHEAQRQRLILMSEQAIDALRDVMKEGRGLAKVNAANSVLDRSGHKPTDYVKADVNANNMNVNADVKVDAKSELLERFNRLAISKGTGSTN